MKLQCIIIDPDPSASEQLTHYIEKLPALQLLQVFKDVDSAKAFIKQNAVQLLFIDIHQSTLHTIESFRAIPEKPMIIWTTAYKKFEPEGFELETVDFLLKPFSFERFRKAVNRATEFYKYKTSLNSKNNYLHVYSDYKLIEINLDDIEFIESLENYIRIYLTDAKPVLTVMPLKKIIQKLPEQKFQRIHPSYVVALKKIKSFTNKKVVLENAEVPVSDSYVEVIRKLRGRQ